MRKINNLVIRIKPIHIIIFTLSAVIFFIQIRYINDVYMPHILADEFGYLLNASYLSGLDWSEYHSLGYYSFGYSLLLVPLFHICETGEQLMQAVNLLNAMFTAISIPIHYLIINKFSKKNGIEFPMVNTIIVCIVAVLNFGYILNATNAWGEIFINLIFSLIILFAINLYEKASMLNLICFSIFNICLYALHQRFISIVLLSVIFVIVLLYLRKCNAKKLCTYTLILVSGILTCSIITNHLTDVLYGGGAVTNSYGGVIQNLLKFDLDYIYNIFTIVLGQIHALGYTTLFVGYFLIYHALRYGIINLKQRKATMLDIISVFLTLSWIGVVMTIALFFAGTQQIRVDMVFYMRYINSILLMIFVVGFALMYRNIKRNRVRNFYKFIVFSGIIIISCVFIEIVSLEKIMASPVSSNSSAYLWLLDHNESQFDLLSFILVPLALCWGLYLVLIFTKKQVLTFCAVTPLVALSYINENTNSVLDFQQISGEIIQTIQSLQPDINTYYYLDNEGQGFSFTAYRLQAYLMDEPLERISKEELVEIDFQDGDIIFDASKLWYNSINSQIKGGTLELKYIKQHNWVSVYEVSSKDCWLTVSSSDMRTIIGNIENNYIEATGTEGILVYGPYYSIPKGEYTAKIPIEIFEFNNEHIGTVYSNAQVDGQAVNILEPIALTDTLRSEGEEYWLEIPIIIKSDVSNLEIVITAYSGSKLNIYEYEIYIN